MLKANHSADIARAHLVNTTVGDALEGMQLLDLRLLLRAVAVAYGDIHAILKRATMHTTHGDTTRITAVIQTRNQHLGRTLELLRSRNDLQNLIQEVVNVVSGLIIIRSHPAILGRTVDHGEVELVLSSIEVAHQIEHHLIHLLRAAVGLVNLVDDHNGLQSNLQGLLQHETRLRHRPFKGINQQQTAVGHVEHTLNLATEIRVARSIENVDFYAFPSDGNVLRKNGNTALTLQIIGVKHCATVILTVAKQFTGEHHLVNQRCLAVVDMRNNCNVTNVLHQ